MLPGPRRRRPSRALARALAVLKSCGAACGAPIRQLLCGTACMRAPHATQCHLPIVAATAYAVLSCPLHLVTCGKISFVKAWLHRKRRVYSYMGVAKGQGRKESTQQHCQLSASALGKKERQGRIAVWCQHINSQPSSFGARWSSCIVSQILRLVRNRGVHSREVRSKPVTSTSSGSFLASSGSFLGTQGAGQSKTGATWRNAGGKKSRKQNWGRCTAGGKIAMPSACYIAAQLGGGSGKKHWMQPLSTSHGHGGRLPHQGLQAQWEGWLVSPH